MSVSGAVHWVAARASALVARVSFAMGAIGCSCCARVSLRGRRCLPPLRRCRPHTTAPPCAALMPPTAVEGFFFAFSRPSATAVVAAELAALVLVVGPRMPTRVAVGTLFACGSLKTAQMLVHSLRHAPVETGLASVWDWEPPAGGDATGAWHILRQLAMTAHKSVSAAPSGACECAQLPAACTLYPDRYHDAHTLCCRLKLENPAVARLLEQPELAGNELAMRFFWAYRADDEPLLSAGQLATLAAAAASTAGGGDDAAAAAAPAAAAEEGADLVDPVPAELREQLAYYRAIACCPYYFTSGGWLCCQRSRSCQLALQRAWLPVATECGAAPQEPSMPSPRPSSNLQTRACRRSSPSGATACSAPATRANWPAAAPPTFCASGERRQEQTGTSRQPGRQQCSRRSWRTRLPLPVPARSGATPPRCALLSLLQRGAAGGAGRDSGHLPGGGRVCGPAGHGCVATMAG